MTQDSPFRDIKIGQISESWALAQNISCDYFPVTTSTNSVAKEDAFSGLEPLQIYLADEQTQGRGRFDHTWANATPGTSLLSSWSFATEVIPSPYFTARVGLALFNAAKSTWPILDFNLKAPNDLFIDEKKVAGLLVETVSQGHKNRIIIGLGFNIFEHPENLPQASHLLEALTEYELLDKKHPVPLLGEDWIRFLDRFLFELMLALPEAHLEPNKTTQYNLLSVFNLHPLLTKKYSSFAELKEQLWR